MCASYTVPNFCALQVFYKHEALGIVSVQLPVARRLVSCLVVPLVQEAVGRIVC